LYDPVGRLHLVNREWERTVGWTLEEAQRIDIVAEIYPEPEVQREVREFIRRADHRWADFKTRTRDGRVIDTSWVRVALSDGRRIGFGQDITERKQAEVALQRSYAELRALSERMRKVREEESARIAREIHDELGQLLTALKLDLGWMERQLGSCPPEANKVLSGKLQSMALVLDIAADVVHRIATELRPGMLDELGLEAVVEWYVHEFQKRTGISCRLRSNLGDGAPDRDRSTALFRILQEALTNVARHSEAAEVEIRLDAERDRTVLAVTDNGRGIPEEAISDSRSLGLLGMRERARALGGDVIVRRASPRGTAVEASVPE
jgi:two-component system, NarL family, sensor histidine kinase UhpB